MKVCTVDSQAVVLRAGDNDFEVLLVVSIFWKQLVSRMVM